MPTLRKGEMIRIANSGTQARIINYIAEGGQGDVYRVEYNGTE